MTKATTELFEKKKRDADITDESIFYTTVIKLWVDLDEVNNLYGVSFNSSIEDGTSELTYKDTKGHHKVMQREFILQIGPFIFSGIAGTANVQTYLTLDGEDFNSDGLGMQGSSLVSFGAGSVIVEATESSRFVGKLTANVGFVNVLVPR